MPVVHAELFKDSLATCLRSNSGRERLASLTQHFSVMFFTNVSRSLFDADKLPFALIMLTRYLAVRAVHARQAAVRHLVTAGARKPS